MALKLKRSISKPGDPKDENPLATIPVFFKVELDRHRKDERVRARLQRVEDRARARSGSR